MYAIIETGGRQYRVSLGEILNCEKLEGEQGSQVTFDKVLLVGGSDQVLIGQPYVAKASLVGEIVDQTRGDKILTIKYKRRKGYRRTIGHRQELTRILFTKMDNGQGGVESFDENKRKEVLMKASIAQPKAASAPKAKKAKAEATGEKAPKKARTTKAKKSS